MNSKQAQETNYKDNFNIVEYAIGNVYKRHNFRQIDSPIMQLLRSELYRSHFIFTGNVEEYYKTHNKDGKPTLEGFDGDLWLDEMVIDIDNDDLSIALEDTKKFIQSLESNYELDLSAIRINFSGSKGFHVRFPSQLFDGFEPSGDLHETIRNIALKLSDGILTIDSSIYGKTRFVRVVNTYNSKSGLYAIPLTFSELLNKSIEEIKGLATNPREFDFVDPEEYGTNEALVNLKSECIVKNDVKPTKAKPKDLLLPKKEGERHETMARLVGKLIHAKWDDEDIRAVVRNWNQQNQPPKEEKLLEKELSNLLNRYKNITGDFWMVKRSYGGLRPSINARKYVEFLNTKGFGKIFFGKSYLFVQIENKLAKQQSPQEIKDYIISYLKSSILDKDIQDIVLEYLLDKVNKYFSERLLEAVDTQIMDMSVDTRKKSFLFYKNGIVVVKWNDEVEIVEYAKLEKPIWDTQIKGREFLPIKIKRSRSEYETLLWNIVRGNEDRMLSVCSAIGYLLHRYKNKNETKAIILMDEKVSDTPAGRTGKSLFGKALSYMKESQRIDGKNFKFRDTFTFQEVGIKTEILEFNDVSKDFNFERLFSILTDDMTIEYKAEKPFTIKFENSPKILLSTNYTIKGEGDSFKDRMFEVEFSDHYNAKNKPIDEFGHLFFDDWDENEWNRFDNFMVECLQLYMEEGLIEYNRINVGEKKLLLETSPEFLEFMNGSFVVSREYDKEILYDQFRSHLGYDNDIFGKCPVKKNTFTKFLKTYSIHRQMQYMERDSNCRQYIRMI